MAAKRISIEAVFLIVGFLGLISCIMTLLASYAERKFFQLVSLIYDRWQAELKELSIGVDEFRERMKAMDNLLPEFRPIRNLLSFGLASAAAGILIYSYSLVAAVKRWKPDPVLLKFFVASAFFFIFAGIASYFVNRKIISATDKVKRLVKRIYR